MSTRRTSTTYSRQPSSAGVKMHNMLPFRRFCLGLALMSVSLSTADALSQSYCSRENTGADFSAVTDIYQSNGACSGTCNANYAFAIVQYQSCWCSNYAPAAEESVSSCNQECPGYGFESCGNAGEGFYGYIALNRQPSGTGGPSSSAPQSSTPQSSTEEQEPSIVSRTVVQTVTQSISQTQPSSTSSSTPPTSSRAPQTTATPTPVTSIVVSTISGDVVTRTVTSTPTAIAPNANDSIQVERSDGLGGGAIAGIVIGVLAGIALVAALIFLLFRRKRNNTADEVAGAPIGSSSGSKKNMSRNVSVLSKAGLLSRGAHPSMTEKDDETYTATGGSVRHSMLFGPSGEAVSPVSPLGSSHGDTNGSRRPSKPMVYDQRLNPSALFTNAEANGSRISMQDGQDYSRPLGVMNPDPRPSFESRA